MFAGERFPKTLQFIAVQSTREALWEVLRCTRVKICLNLSSLELGMGTILRGFRPIYDKHIVIYLSDLIKQLLWMSAPRGVWNLWNLSSPLLKIT